MFCPHCGAGQPISEAKYCKRCGENLSALMQANTQIVQISTGAVWGVGLFTFLTFTVGFGTLVGALAALADKGLRSEPLAAIAVFGFASIFGVMALMVYMMLKIIGASNTKKDAKKADRLLSSSRKKTADAPLFAPANIQAQLGEVRTPFTPVGSITESTTRNLESIYREPRS
ncbi:MAG: hypothetical protein NVSMB56_18660 [Pyrinomonadaceae bacterium]